MKNPFITEHTATKKQPWLNPGGYLETKDGQLCLRLADTVTTCEYGGATLWHLTRQWQRPGEQPFNNTTK